MHYKETSNLKFVTYIKPNIIYGFFIELSHYFEILKIKICGKISLN